MAFSQHVSLRPASQPRYRTEPPAKTGRRGSAVDQGLAEKLRKIAAAANAPEDAIEPALLAILEGTSTPAGAVCLYDPHQQVLRLVAEVGLSDEGCRALRNVRPGSANGWEMPHQSLLSRRAYVIENASENHFVPSLLDDEKAAYNVACLPLYAGTSPVGSLIIITIRPSGFGEHQIRELEQPQRELVKMIEALRSQAAKARAPASRSHQLAHDAEALPSSSTEPDRAAVPPDGSTARQAERRVSPELSGSQGETEEIQLLRAQLAETTAHAAAQAQESLTALQRKHDELAAEVERLRAQLSETEAAAATRELESRQAQAAEVEHLLELLNEARDVAAQERRINEDLKSALELESRRLTEALQQAALANEQALEQAAELERLRTQIGDARTAAATRDEELIKQLRHEQQELAGELETTATRAQQANEARASALELERSRVVALRTELDTLKQDHAAEVELLTARLAESESARALETGRIDELKQVNAGLAEKLEAASASEDRLRLDLDTINRLADEKATELKDTRECALTGERALGEARAEAATMRHGLAEARARIDEMHGTLAQSEQRVARLEARANDAENRGSQLERELDAARARLREAEEQLTTSRRETPGPSMIGSMPTSTSSTEDEVTLAEQPVGSKLGSVKARNTSHERASVTSDIRKEASTGARTTPVARPEESASRHFVIIDREESWSSIPLDEQQVSVVSPGDDLSRRLANPHREPILVNLAVHGSLAAVSALREAGLTTRFLAYIAAPGAERALRLGMIETTPSPMDPEVVLSTLAGYIGTGTRLLTAVADVDAVMSLRQAVSRQGVSVSMAWDSHQAQDLLAIIRPEVAVIDLDLPPRDGYRLLTGLADLNPVPSAVLISKRIDGADRFAAEAADRSHAHRLITLHDLLGNVLRTTEPPRSAGH